MTDEQLISMLDDAAMQSVLHNSSLSKKTLYWLAARRINELAEEVKMLKAEKRGDSIFERIFGRTV